MEWGRHSMALYERCFARTHSPGATGLWGSRLHLPIRAVLGGVFVWAGLTKLVEPRAFARVIDQYGLLPEDLLPLVAIGLPVLELLTGAGVVLGFRRSLDAA